MVDFGSILKECFFCAGGVECWSAGVLECWSAGVLECWSAGTGINPIINVYVIVIIIVEMST